MIDDNNERMLNFFELKEYVELFRIPYPSDKKLKPMFNFGSPRNRNMFIMIKNNKK